MKRSERFPRRNCARGFTLIELLVVLALIGLLTALLLPAVQYARESGRRSQCQNNLRQIGLALHQYHGVKASLPPGCLGDAGNSNSSQAWGWAALTLPYLEQSALYDTISPEGNNLAVVLNDSTTQPLVQTSLTVFRCPSDAAGPLVHDFRLLEGFVYTVAQNAPPIETLAAHTSKDVRRTLTVSYPRLGIITPLPVFGCIILPSGNSGSGNPVVIVPGSHVVGDGGPGDGLNPGSSGDPGSGSGAGVPYSGGTVSGTGVFGIPSSVSNYVGSFGDTWRPDCTVSDPSDLQGNGTFGSVSPLTLRDITDGTSNTFLVGERSTRGFGAAWVGVDGNTRFDTQGLSMVLGTAAYPLNSDGNPYNLSCDAQGAAGYSSAHSGGASFLMADGAVRFVTNSIEFQPSATSPGAYQRLARRDDGQQVSVP